VDMDVDMDGKFHIHGKPGHMWPEVSDWSQLQGESVPSAVIIVCRD